MTRITKKYRLACKELGVPTGAGVPHEALYGMLALRGFSWNGEGWSKPDEQMRPASIRVSAGTEYLQSITDAICAMVEISGGTVKSITGPYGGKRQPDSRVYIDFIHPEEW